MRKKIMMAIGCLLIVVGLIFGIKGLVNYIAEKNAGKYYEDIQKEMAVKPIVDVPTATPEKMENPIDFDSLSERYPDVYAWITIPGTNVNYPIVNREGDNSYYLKHTIEGKQRSEGSIYTEDYNKKDFSDPNTVIYGHNMKNGSMFKTLHRYKDKSFFREHQDVFIYQKGRVLKYRVFAAYVYDSRHILESFDFEDEDIFRIYINSVLTKRDISSNIDTEVDVSTDDRIITLSTCNNNPSQRYLVQAVLLSIQE